MHYKEYYESKNNEGKKQISAILKNLKNKGWTQKNKLWEAVSRVKQTKPRGTHVVLDKPFKHRTTFERVLEDLNNIEVIEKKEEILIKCPNCKKSNDTFYPKCIHCGNLIPPRLKEKKKKNTFYILMNEPEVNYLDIVFTDKLFLDWYDKEEFTSIPHVNVYGSRLPYFEPRVKEILEKIKNLTIELYNLNKEETGDDRHITIVAKSVNIGFLDVPVLSELPKSQPDKKTIN